MSGLFDRISFSSPPCYMHELELGENGYNAINLQASADVARWRCAERKRLIAGRIAVARDERRLAAYGVATELDRLIEPGPGKIVSLYWPIRGELDLRGWMKSAHQRGARVALPLVVGKDEPLIFREWTPDCKMECGIWKTPHPADGAAVLPKA